MDNLDTPIQETDEQRRERRHREQEEGKKLIQERAEREKLEAALVKMHVEKATANPDHLVDLYDELPDIAEKVAKKFQKEDGSRIRSFNDYMESMKPGKTASYDPDREKFDRYYAEKTREEEARRASEVASDEFKHLTEEQREQAEEDYRFLTNGRTLTRDEAKKIASMVAAPFGGRKKPTAGISPTSSVGTSYVPEPTEIKSLAEQMGLGHVYSPKK